MESHFDAYSQPSIRDAPDDALARRLAAIIATRVWRARDRNDILCQLGFLDSTLLDELAGAEEEVASVAAPVDQRAERIKAAGNELPDFDALVAAALKSNPNR